MNRKLNRFVLFAFFVAIELVLMFTPLGYVPIGILRATTMHIPVIICGIILGKKEGALLGFVFGLTSLFINTFQPTPISFVMSPFISIGGNSGNFYSLIVVFVPRILLGYSAGLLYSLFKNINKNLSLIITSLVSTFIHTFSFLMFIYLFFAEPYASVKNVSVDGLFKVLMGIVFSNGLLEMILASIVVSFVVKFIYPKIGSI